MAESKIVEYLNKIKSAVYGRDVRTAIYNAINQCYADGKAGAIDLVARQTLETKANKSAIGAPLVAATAADMTNTSKVYVYVGSEEGYTNGNWYYYEDGAWLSGGQYNSVALGDGAISTNYIADGAVTRNKLASDVVVGVEDGSVTDASVADNAGIQIGKLANINVVVEQEEAELLTTAAFVDGVYLSSGAEVANELYSTCGPIYVGNATTLRCEFDRKNYSCQFDCFNATGTYLGRVSSGYAQAGDEKTLSVKEGTVYIRISMSTGMVYSGYVRMYLMQDVHYYDFHDTTTGRWVPLEKRAEHETHLTALDTLLWNYTKWAGKVLVTDGNSLVASVNWGSHLASFLHMTHVQCGMSGSDLTKNETTKGHSREDILNNIKDAYPAAADLVILQGDTNQGSLSGDPSDQMDGENPKQTWMARMNYMIRCIKAKFPNVVLVLMPDSIRYDSQAGQNPASPCIYYQGNAESHRAFKALADYNFCYYWPFDGDTPFNPLSVENYYSRLTAASNFTDTDGTHPNDHFAYAKGRALAHWVAGLAFHPDAPNAARTGWENYVTASITNNLTGVSNSRSAVDWQYYMPYNATLTADEGTIQSVTITMGGEDITASVYNNGRIMIDRITGDLVITASN